MTSTPFLNVTPWMTLGNRASPFSRRQVLAAAITSLNTISRAVSWDSAPLAWMVRCRTVANTLSTGLAVRRRIGTSDTKDHKPRRWGPKIPEEWNATRVAVERQRLTEWQHDLEEREAALRRGREAFYTNLQKRPRLWQQAAIRAPELLEGQSDNM